VRSSVPRDLDAVTVAALGDERSAGSEISTAEELVEELAAIAPGDAVFDPGLLRLEGSTGTQTMPGGYGPSPATAAKPPTGLPATAEYEAADYPPRGHTTSNYGPPRRAAGRTAPGTHQPDAYQPDGYQPGTYQPDVYPPASAQRGGTERTSAYGDQPPPYYREPERRPPAPSRGRGNRRLLAIVAVLLVITVGAVAAVVSTSDNRKPSAAPTTATTSTPGTGPTLTPARTRSFDPLSADADKTEKEERVPDAFDGNPATSWETSSYNDQLGGAFKSGVGLMMEFDQPVEARELQITLSGGSTGFQLLAGEAASSAIGDYQVAAAETDASGTVIVPVNSAGAHRYWVLWLTKLPQVGKYKGTIVDLTLRS
jgi:hypothetical protein